MRNDLTQEQLKALLSYDPDTGIFKWLDCNRNHRDDNVAGSKRLNGYISIRVDYSLYYAHRLAWLYMTGDWPKDQIDHINRTRDDNRFCNLREATLAQNNLNSKIRSDSQIGLKGAYRQKGKNRFYSKITYRGELYRLGYFDTAEEAHEAYCKKADELHGEFANYG